MPGFTEELRIGAASTTVFDVLADARNEVQWNEGVSHAALVTDEPIRQGSDFIVCPDAKLPGGAAPQWVHEVYGFLVAAFTFAIVFGAFAANVLYGAMQAVPRAQVETAEALAFPEDATRK